MRPAAPSWAATASPTRRSNSATPSPARSIRSASRPMPRRAPGDALVFTKRLGTGVISTALKRGIAARGARCGGHPFDADAEPAGLRGDAAVRRPWLHRCHRVRADRARARDGVGQRRHPGDRTWTRCAFCRARWTMRGGRHSGRPEQQSRVRLLRGGNPRARCRARWKTCSTIRRPPGGLLIALPETDAAALERSLDEAYRIGRVLPRGAKPIRLDMNRQSDHCCAGCGIGRRGAAWWRGWANQIDFYKVGMELYAAAGMEFVRELCAARQGRVPRSEVLRHPRDREARGVRWWRARGVRFLTVHGSGPVMRAAVEGPGRFGPETAGGHGAHQLRPAGYPGSRLLLRGSDLVDLRVRKAMEARMRRHGMLAAGRRRACARHGGSGKDHRDAGSAFGRAARKGDQKRVATPAEAMRDGADYVVMGRQITRAADPAARSRECWKKSPLASGADDRLLSSASSVRQAGHENR